MKNISTRIGMLYWFQHDLDTITEWSNTWQPSFSFSKCKHLQGSYTLSVECNLMDHQNGMRKTISHVDDEQDLGVWRTADLKLSLQCKHAVSKSTKALGLIKRTFKFFSSVSLSKLYKTYMFVPFGVLYPSVVSILDWWYWCFVEGSTQGCQINTYYC